MTLLQPIILFSTNEAEPVFVDKHRLAWPACGMVVAVQSNVLMHPTPVQCDGVSTWCALPALAAASTGADCSRAGLCVPRRRCRLLREPAQPCPRDCLGHAQRARRRAADAHGPVSGRQPHAVVAVGCRPQRAVAAVRVARSHGLHEGCGAAQRAGATAVGVVAAGRQRHPSTRGGTHRGGERQGRPCGRVAHATGASARVTSRMG